jgi:signal transduction histidine kinase
MLTLVGAVVRPRLRQRILRNATAQALAQERWRLAAEVHDLVMQELVVAIASARTLLQDSALAPEASSAVAAGERALAAAREIVGELTTRDREPPIVAVEASVRAAARKANLSFDASGVSAEGQTDTATCDALVHIGREAVTNAIKHAQASAIAVVLERGEEWRLTVVDDGHGFEPAAVGRGFGLDSMSMTARTLGGWLRLQSAPGAGTKVEAVLP